MKLKVIQLYTAYRNGIHNAYGAARVADDVGLPLYAAYALLEKESGGRNIFGHDPTIFAGAGRVTKRKYLEYRAMRDRTGKSQGVGPCQLTWRGFQNKADALGGCWIPKYNMQVGFGLLKEYHDTTGSWQAAGTKYNGSPEYGRDFATRVEKWRKRFA